MTFKFIVLKLVIGAKQFKENFRHND